MIKDPIHIKFVNQQMPQSAFDCVQLDDILNLKAKDHSPFQLHLVEFYIIYFVEQGAGVHTIDFQEYKISKGSIITIRKDQIHKFQNNKNLKGQLLLFTDDFLVSYLENLESLKTMRLFNEIIADPVFNLTKSDFLQIQSLISQIHTEYFSRKDDYSLGIIRSLLHVLITQLFRIKSSKISISNSRKYLSDFVKFQKEVEQNIFRTNQVKDYGALLGVSTKTLNNITNTIVNKSAKAFIDSIYIKQIKRLLINTELSIKEIAYETGFEESTNFYKYFKRHTHLTPEQFRTTKS